jgi:hypothetical protein
MFGLMGASEEHIGRQVCGQLVNLAFERRNGSIYVLLLQAIKRVLKIGDSHEGEASAVSRKKMKRAAKARDFAHRLELGRSNMETRSGWSLRRGR